MLEYLKLTVSTIIKIEHINNNYSHHGVVEQATGWIPYDLN